jgi:hypothetical protein
MVTANSVNAQNENEEDNEHGVARCHSSLSERDRNRAFRRPIPLLGNDALDVLSGKNVEFNLTFARER